jgi:hypothetical protein
VHCTVSHLAGWALRYCCIATQRLSAVEILRHPWITGDAPATVLTTPTIFRDR